MNESERPEPNSRQRTSRLHKFVGGILITGGLFLSYIGYHQEQDFSQMPPDQIVPEAHDWQIENPNHRTNADLANDGRVLEGFGGLSAVMGTGLVVSGIMIGRRPEEEAVALPPNQPSIS